MTGADVDGVLVQWATDSSIQATGYAQHALLVSRGA